ncbi:MAG: hypothetical protein ABIX01_00775 [Chitinophagaceae bacterium]
MQQQQTTNGQPGKRSADYVTLVAQACANVPEFAHFTRISRDPSVSAAKAAAC